MRVKRRLLAVAIALVVPGIAFASWMLQTYQPPGPVTTIEVPDEVGPWRGVQDDVFSPEVVSRLGMDSYRLRQYAAPQQATIWLYVGMYGALRAGGGKYHDPAGCFPAQGWEVMDYQQLEIDMIGSGTLHSQIMEVQRGSERQSVLYWFQPFGRWPADRSAAELLRVFDAIRGSPEYAFVRLSAPAGPTSERNLVEFAAEIAPTVRAAVESVGP
ncbi:MAG: EpsI family protein [Deltaproteobacteria bacterium]|nr:EpsI family protein [Deltaproteobacteria bacterium]